MTRTNNTPSDDPKPRTNGIATSSTLKLTQTNNPQQIRSRVGAKTSTTRTKDPSRYLFSTSSQHRNAHLHRPHAAGLQQLPHANNLKFPVQQSYSSFSNRDHERNVAVAASIEKEENKWNKKKQSQSEAEAEDSVHKNGFRQRRKERSWKKSIRLASCTLMPLLLFVYATMEDGTELRHDHVEALRSANRAGTGISALRDNRLNGSNSLRSNIPAKPNDAHMAGLEKTYSYGNPQRTEQVSGKTQQQQQQLQTYPINPLSSSTQTTNSDTVKSIPNQNQYPNQSQDDLKQIEDLKHKLQILEARLSNNNDSINNNGNNYNQPPLKTSLTDNTNLSPLHKEKNNKKIVISIQNDDDAEDNLSVTSSLPNSSNLPQSSTGATSTTLSRRSDNLRSSPGIPLPNQISLIQQYLPSSTTSTADETIQKKKKYKPSKQLLQMIQMKPHQISGLNCNLYGGPYADASTVANTTTATTDAANNILDTAPSLNKLVYWKDVKSDAAYRSPFYRDLLSDDDTDDYNDGHLMDSTNSKRDSTTKYITFEPDNAGWNNRRMGLETVLVMSAAMGRTLVLPPRQPFSLMDAGNGKDKIFGFDDFFHLDSLNKEYAGINIITMEEFLLREGIQGKLHQYNSSNPVLPPGNRTNWNFARDLQSLSAAITLKPLWEYLRGVSHIPTSWQPTKCVVAFPAVPGEAGNNGLDEIMKNILIQKDGRPFPRHFEFQGRPVFVNAPPIERMREIMAGRTKLCLYSQEMQDATVIHFPQSDIPDPTRLLTHYYSFIFFEDWRQSTWANRLIRDHLRYNDEIMCAAARVVDALQQRAYNRENPHGNFDSLHVRRTDFLEQFNMTVLSANNILERMIPVTGQTSKFTLFVATDEKDKSFFEPMNEVYDVCFLDDFEHLLYGINSNLYGMIEQVVASQGRNFFGTFFSSFSGYIMRLRGYYSEDKDGNLKESFYFPQKFHNEMRLYRSVRQPFFAREYPVAWKDIDKGVGEMKWEGWR